MSPGSVYSVTNNTKSSNNRQAIDIPSNHITFNAINNLEKSVDKDQLLAVINRQAGLKPIGLTHNPMRPRSHCGTKQRLDAGEPLYRRAKNANHLREIPKVPVTNFQHSQSTPYMLDNSQSTRPNSRSPGNENPSDTKLPPFAGSAGVLHYNSSPQIIFPMLNGKSGIDNNHLDNSSQASIESIR